MSNNDSSSNFTQTPSANHGMKALSQLLPVAIAITLANGLVLALFYRKKRLRTQSNYLLLSLAICDLLTGTINIPYFIVYSFQVVTSTMFVNFLYIVHTLMAVSAAYHILTITAEKYLAIMKPLRHRLVTKTTVFKCLAGIWMISTFIAVITLVWNESSSRLLWYIIHSVFCLVFVFFIPYVFMIYAFARMFRKITKRQRSSSVHRGTSRLQQNDQKCILVFATMAAIFVLCWLPYFTLMLILNINDYLESGPSLSLSNAIHVFLIMRYMTSITNPLLYTYFKRDFWFEIRNICSFSTSERKSRRSGELTTKLTRPRNTRGSNMEHVTETHSREVIAFISSV